MTTRPSRPIGVLILSAALAIATATPSPAQVLMRPTLSPALALKLAQAAQGACQAQGHAVAVAVADPAGVVGTLISAADAGEMSVESASRKAHTAAKLGFPTAILAKAVTEAPSFAEFVRSLDPRMVMLGGGVPVRVGGQVAGAIGVGGAPRPEIDEACANAALTALADQLK